MNSGQSAKYEFKEISILYYLFLYVLCSLPFEPCIASEHPLPKDAFSDPKSDFIIIRNHNRVNVISGLHLFEDHDFALTLEKAISKSFASNFEKIPADNGNSGNTEAIIWCRFKLDNQISEPLYLELDNPLIKYAILYEVDEQTGQIDSTHYSAYFPFNDRDVLIPNFVFPLRIPKDQQRTYYLKLETVFPFYYPLTVAPLPEILLENNLSNILDGAFLGMIAIMMLYNFFIYLGIKDKTYLVYIVYMFLGGLFVAHVSGFAFYFLWPDTPLINKYVGTFACLGMGSVLVFSSIFLRIKYHLPKVYKLILLYLWIFGGFIIFNVLYANEIVVDSRFSITLALTIIQVVLYVGSVTLVFAAIVIYRKGLLIAKTYLIALVILLTGAIGYDLVNLGFLPINFWMKHTLEFGMAMEACLLSFALTQRYNQAKEGKKAVENQVLIDERKNQQRLLEKEVEKVVLIEEERAKLEMSVTERTKELSQLNSTKDHFFSIISHDLRNVTSSFHGIGHMIKQHLRKQRFQKAETLVDQLDKEAHNLHMLLDNLLNWSVNQLGETPFKPEPIDLNIIIKEVYELYIETAKAKKINFHLELEKIDWVEADVDSLNIVLRNLISNAIKFTDTNGNIRIAVMNDGERVKVMVTDTGIGISDKIVKMIKESVVLTSSNGTMGERGNGLGLNLCKEYLHLHGSELKIRKNVHGSAFEFWLKCSTSARVVEIA